MSKLDEGSRYVQLASWAVAGIHCSTRAEQETYRFYCQNMTNHTHLDQEKAPLELRIALILADLRKRFVEELVADNEEEPLHQIAHLEKKMGIPLALIGDAERFNDQFQGVIKNRYKNMTETEIVVTVQRRYTVDTLTNILCEEVNKPQGSRLSFNVLNEAFEKQNITHLLGDFYDEDATFVTPEGAKALLYSTGYLEEDR